jgi:site-specific recombinase XerD
MREGSFDIHNYKGRLKVALRKVEEANITGQNKKLILRFHKHCYAEGLSTPRIQHYVLKLRQLAEWLGKDFAKATREDVEGVVRKIEQMDYSEWTKHGFKVTLKKFYKWLKKSEHYPKEVRWIKSTVKNESTRLPEELLTEEDVKKLIEVADHPRDKALVSVL